MEQNRLKIYQLLLDDEIVVNSSFDDFNRKYFSSEGAVKKLFDYLVSHKSPRGAYYYTNTLNDFYKKYACDLFSNSTHCGGNGNNNQNSTTWDKFACVSRRPDFKDGATFTYTSSQRDYGQVTLSPNGTFTATGKNNKGVWSCTQSGKIYIEYKDTPAPNPNPNSDSNNNSGSDKFADTNLNVDDLASGKTVSYGMRGDIVTKIQQLLSDRGFRNVSKDKAPDGKFGNRTKRMVSAFQAFADLNDTGVVDKATWDKLNDPKLMANVSSSPDMKNIDAPVPGSDAVIMEQPRKKILRNYLLKHSK